MKKILIFGLAHTNEDSRVFYKQAISLSKKFIIECVWGVFSDKKGLFYNKGIQNIGITGNRFIILYKSFIYGIKNKSDIYVAHDIDSYLVVVLIKIFRWKSKIIFDSHEYYGNMYQDKENIILHRLFFFIFYKIIRKLSLNIFSGITVVTEDMKDNYSIISNKEVIYNFPLSNNLNNVKINKKIKEKYKDNFILIFQGNITEERGIFEYLKMINVLKNNRPEIKLLLLGNINNNIKNKIKYYIHSNNLNKYIDILGKLPLFEVYEYTKISNVGLNFLKPSFNNNNGIQIKIFEYIYLDTPVLGTSNNHNFINFITDNFCGYAVEYGNIKSELKGLKEIYNNYSYYQNNCKINKNKYIWINEEKKLLNLYENILNIRR